MFDDPEVNSFVQSAIDVAIVLATVLICVVVGSALAGLAWEYLK